MLHSMLRQKILILIPAVAWKFKNCQLILLLVSLQNKLTQDMSFVISEEWLLPRKSVLINSVFWCYGKNTVRFLTMTESKTFEPNRKYIIYRKNFAFNKIASK